MPMPVALPNFYSGALPVGQRQVGRIVWIWRWYFHVFLKHFVLYIPLPVTLPVLLGMLTNSLGHGYGVDRLIWHDSGWKQFIHGAAISLVFAEVLFAGYLLWQRDDREGRVGGSFESWNTSYGEYAWCTLASLIGTIGYVALVAVLIGLIVGPGTVKDRFSRVSEIGQATLDVPNNPLPYTVPWVMVVGGVLVGLAFWFKWGRYVGARAKNGRKQVGVKRAGLYFSGLIGAIIVLNCIFMILTTPLSSPPGYGAFFGMGSCLAGIMLILLSYIVQTHPGALNGLVRLASFFNWLVGARMQRWRIMCWLAAFMTLIVVWGLLLVAAYSRSWLEVLLVIVGTIMTFRLLRSEYKEYRNQRGAPAELAPGPSASSWTKYTLAVALAINIAVAVAGLTYVPSHYLLQGRRLLFYFVFAPLVPVLVVAILIAFAPASASIFFSDPVLARSSSRSLSDMERDGRRRAAVGLAVGWALFIAVSAWVETPIPMLCALLFGVVGLFGLVVYAFRGALMLLVLALVLFAVLPVPNLYEFRVPALDPYDQVAGRLVLSKTLENDDQSLLEARAIMYPYLATQKKVSRLTDRIAATERAVEVLKRDGAKDDDLDVKRLTTEARNAKEERGRLGARLEKQKTIAKIAFQRIMVGNRVVGENHGELFELLRGADRPELLLEQEDVRWADYGGEGGKPGLTPNGRRPLILVAVSGGALRSAVWTLLILQKLELAFAEKKHDFPAHTRIITGASGGMLGAAYYVASLEPPKKRKGDGDRRAEMEGRVNELRQDCISPLMRQFLFGDLPQLFSPWPARYDRGMALERAWGDVQGVREDEKGNVKKVLETTFGDLRKQDAQGWCPSLVFTPTMVEDGRRLVISNLNWRPRRQSGAGDRGWV
jgi:hypothetical protein